MSIEAFDVSGGFDEFGEFWELVAGEWGERAIVDKTNEVELENVRGRTSKIFRFKQPGSLDFLQTKELASFKKIRHWEVIDSHSPKQASYFSKENRRVNDLSQRQVDILSFGPEECYAPLQGTRYFPSFDEAIEGDRLSFMEAISPWLARGHLNEKPILAHQYQNPHAMQCGFKKSFQKACHKVGKTWKKHKVEILIGAAIVVVIVVTVVVVASTGGTAGGAIAAGGCAALNELVNGDREDRPPSEFPSDPDQPSLETLVKEEKPVANKPLSIEEKWDSIKNSPYFTEKGIEPQSPLNLGMQSLPPDPIRPWSPAAPCPIPMEKQEKPKEIAHPIPPESSVSPAYRSLNPNQRMTFGQWYTEYTDKEENGVLYYSEEEPVPLENSVFPPSRSPNSSQSMTFGQWYTEYMDKEENGVLYYSEKEPVPLESSVFPPSPNSSQSMTFGQWYTEYMDKEENGVLYYSEKEPVPLESSVFPPFPNSSQSMTFRQWYAEYMDKEENGVLYYSEEEFAKSHDPNKTFELNQFIKDKKEQTSYDVNILCQDEMAFVPKAWHERNQVAPIPSSQRLPTLGASNKEMLIMGINGIGTDIEAARDHQAYLKNFVPDNVGVDFIHNSSNSIVVDVLEAVGLNYFGFSPKTANLLQETWTEFHEYHKDNPAKKILHICHSQGAIHTYNALINCPQEVRDRLFIIEIAPAKIIPEGICYQGNCMINFLT